MIEVFTFHQGELPLLISVPHDGSHLPNDLKARMTRAGIALPDTDWHVAELYDFARDLGASMLIANYSRYVVDLNRSAADEALYPGQLATGLCPLQTFAGDAIYSSSSTTDEEKAGRVARYWQPYHDKIEATLAAMHSRHGHALLWDAHSIASSVPRLFDGELPELNIGTNDGRSCAPAIADAVVRTATAGSYGVALDARFKGGYITRHYGKPDDGTHAIQLEIAQRAYMDERTTAFDVAKAGRLRSLLRRLLQSFCDSALRHAR